MPGQRALTTNSRLAVDRERGVDLDLIDPPPLCGGIAQTSRRDGLWMRVLFMKSSEELFLLRRRPIHGGIVSPASTVQPSVTVQEPADDARVLEIVELGCDRGTSSVEPHETSVVIEYGDHDEGLAMLAIEDLVRVVGQLISVESVRERIVRRIRRFAVLVLHVDENFGPAPGNAGTKRYLLSRDPACIRRPRRCG